MIFAKFSSSPMKIFIYPRSECSGSRGSSFPESMEPLHYVIWVDGREYPGTAGSPYTSRNPMCRVHSPQILDIDSMAPMFTKYAIHFSCNQRKGASRHATFTPLCSLNLLLDGEGSIVIVINLIILVLWIGTGFPKA